MFGLQIPAWELVVRTLVVYIALLIGLRLAGKRQISQMNPVDLVVLLLIANSVQGAMVGSNTSLAGGLLAAAVLLAASSLFTFIRLHLPGRLRRVVEGSPTLLILHGKVLTRNLQREGLDRATLEAAVRSHGIQDLADVDMAVLEVNGSISIVRAESEHAETEETDNKPPESPPPKK